MTKNVFIASCKIAYDNYDHIFLGGGEPTLHPQFAEFLGLAILYNGTHGDIPSGVITNGSNERITINLLHAAEVGAIYCAVSLDNWHDQSMISNEVMRLAKRYNMIRNTTEPIPKGRASNINSIHNKDACVCDDIFVTPRGSVYACGCKTKRIGSIFETKRILNFIMKCREDNQSFHEHRREIA